MNTIYKTFAFLVLLCAGQQAMTQNFITQWNLATAGSGATQLSFGTATSGSVNYTWQEISPGTATGSGSWTGLVLNITGLPVGATIRLQIASTNFQRINISNGSDRNRLTLVEQWGSTSWSSMSQAFYGCTNLQVTANDIPDLSNVSSMESMFFGCANLNSPTNIGSWNTAAVTNMRFMFSFASDFNQDIGTWNTGAVTNMERMFQQAFAFNNGGNGSIDNWNTGAVINMDGMFFEAIAFNQNIGSWDTGVVNDMTAMFSGAIAFNQNINSWDTKAVTTMYQMFSDADSFNQNIGSWNTGAVTDMSRMFSLSNSFNNGGNGAINNWNTTSVTSMFQMFFGANAFNQNIGSWDTGAVTNMSTMFASASSFDQNIGSWNTGAVTDMSSIFFGAFAFNRNIGGWNLNPGVDLSSMFNNCGMDCNNYSATLIGWSANPTIPSGRLLGANFRAYGTNAVAARINLTTTKGWTITGDFPAGAACSSGLVPTIAFFNPPSGSIGTTVIITGTNFDVIAANNIVKFNGINALTPSSASANSLTVIVPVGSTTGLISVTTPDGTGISSSDFVVTVSQNFITQWDLSITGSSPTELTFGTATSGVVNYTWQEISPGNATGSGSWSGTTLTIAGLPAGSTIRLQVEPTSFQRIIIDNGSDRERLTQVENWGSTAWTSMQNAFYGCINLQVSATDAPDLSGVTDMSLMFADCTNLNSPNNINSWDTGTVTNMNYLFGFARAFNQNIGAWNTASVTNMSYMFRQANAFDQNIGAWNTGAVTNMEFMFSGAYTFNNGGNGSINSWDTGDVTSMNSMFSGAEAFNQNIGAWNVGSVTIMLGMFEQAKAFNNGGDGSINNWNTGLVTDMLGMFTRAIAFNQNIGSWNTGAVTSMAFMFREASVFNQNIGAWNTGAVTNMVEMFRLATSFNQNISSWNTTAVTIMAGMFRDASAFNQNIGAWTLNTGVNLANMLDDSGMDCNNYSATLNGWSANPLTPNGRVLGANGRQYGTNAVAARTNLTTTKGWTIAGDSPSGAVCAPPASVPTITSFTPTSGPIGTSVTITGTNFDTAIANNIVYFGATRATVTGATATQLTVTVPTGATYEPITVQVAGLTGFSNKPFVVTFAGGGTIDACSFAPRVNFATGTTPLSIYFGDLDGDGKADMVTGNQNANTISVFRNISTSGTLDGGSFAASVSFSVGVQPYLIVIGDVDGDGKRDLMIPNESSGTVSVLRNTSAVGALDATSFAAKVDFVTGAGPHSVFLEDVDADGKPEMVTANHNNNTLSVLKNTSTPGVINASSFAAKVDFGTGTNPQSVGIADLDGDGMPDLVVTNGNAGTNTVSVLRNTTSPGIINASSFSAKVDFTTGFYPRSLAIGDIDNDGKLDLVTANFSSNSISVLRNTSSSGSITAGSFAASVNFTTGSGPHAISISDLDGDGGNDIVVANAGSASIGVFKNQSTPGTITAASLAAKVDFIAGFGPVNLALGDVDGDGKNDITVSNGGANTFSVYRNLIGLISPPTIISFTLSGAIGSSVTITGTNFSTPFTNTIKFNGVSATITASTATSLTVTVPAAATTGPLEVTIGCNTVMSASNFTVTVPGTIIISPQPTSLATCNGTSPSFIIAASGTTNIAYQWQIFNGTIFTDVINGVGYSGATATTFNINTTGNFGAGDYRCKVSGDLAPDVFSNTVTLTINLLPTPPTIPVQPVPVCGPSAVIPITATGGTPGQYRWYTVATGGTSITGATNAAYSPTVTSSPTNFFVSIYDGTCESARTPVSVTLLPVPLKPAIAVSGPLTLCTGGSVTLTPPSGFDSYLWSDASTTNQPRVITSATTLSLRVTNSSNCTSVDSDPVVVTVSPCPPTVTTSTLTVTLGASTTLDLTSLITGQAALDLSTLKIKVQPPSGAIASIIPPATLKVDYAGITFSGTETVTIEVCNVVGECASQNFTVQVDGSLTYFNAVSANGDDKNATFFIQNIDLLPETKNNLVIIYNRWGDVVFEAENYDNVSKVFRGLSNSGDELPSGTYYYKVKFASGKSEKTGFIALRK